MHLLATELLKESSLVPLDAQAVTLIRADFAIATTNVGHLSRFVAADLWQNIKTS